MALVNKLQIKRKTKNCADLKKLFGQKLIKYIQRFDEVHLLIDEVHLLIDQYISTSLKEQYQQKIVGGKATKFVIKYSTPLKGIKTKIFLSHIETKSDLTLQLAE